MPLLVLVFPAFPPAPTSTVRNEVFSRLPVCIRSRPLNISQFHVEHVTPMRAAVPLPMRAAALPRLPDVRSRATTRCCARARAHASASVAQRPSAASSVAFESPAPRSSPPFATRGPPHAPSRARAHPRRGVAVTPHAAVAAAVAQAVGPSVSEMACAASIGYSVAAFAAFWLGARDPVRFAKCARFTRSPASLAPPCVLYLALLVASWAPDTLSLMMPGSLRAGLADGGFNPQFFPTLDGIATLLSRRAVSASAWTHLVCVNLFVGRHAALEAARGGWSVAHTLALAFAFGPAGLLSHFLTSRRSKGIET